MERLEVKDQERQFKELPRTFSLDIIMARRQQDNKKRDKRTSFFRQTGLWGSGSTGKQAIKLLKTHTKKKTRLAALVKIDIYTSGKKTSAYLSHSIATIFCGQNNKTVLESTKIYICY